MKFIRNVVCAFFVTILLFAACVPYLLYEDTLPSFNAPEDKAKCVIVRLTTFSGKLYTPVWVDKKLAGGTTGKTIASFTVEPGDHLIITKAKRMAAVKLHFEAGKQYYLLQDLFSDPKTGLVTSLTPTSCTNASAKIELGLDSLKHCTINPESVREDLTDDDVKQVLADWDTWLKENPEKAKTVTEYIGCIY